MDIKTVLTVRSPRHPCLCRAILLLGLLLLRSPAIAGSEQDRFHWEKVVGGRQQIEVTLSKRRFDISREGVQVKSGQLFLNGHKAIGTDGRDASSELSEFVVKWNGRDVAIPREAYADIVNPSLAPLEHSAGEGSVLILPNESGSALLISLGGGDAAGAFTVWWTITREGLWARFVEGPP